jgi:DmsE family decaheme c-type cytochrome
MEPIRGTRAARRALSVSAVLLLPALLAGWAAGADPDARAPRAASQETTASSTSSAWAAEPAVEWTPEDCAVCHENRHAPALNTPHRRAGLDCGSCHHVDDAAPHWETGESPVTSCAGCHGDVVARFDLNERHRLHEGIISCTDCHDPHEPSPVGRLGGFRQDVCLDCHTDKGGPFVFEHGASRVDGCISCHEPHGSPNRHLLTFQDTGQLCYSCHAVVPQFHFGFNAAAPPRFGLDTQCTNCHSSIHGSNFDPFFLQ